MAARGVLVGRLALVTGAGSGIGRSVCQLFAKEGAKVAVVDVNESGAEETLQSLPGDHHMFKADISSSGEVGQLLKDVQLRFTQTPCIAVNSAGVTRDNFLLQLDEGSFDKVIQVNLKGAFLVTQAVSKAMVEGGIKNGSIVNLASLVGKTGNLGQANYAASKAGVEGLTRTAAKELGMFGIRCNAVLPGFIDTPMTRGVPEKVINKIKKFIPAGRMGHPDEVAETCLFLASDRSSYITGSSIEVTGGLNM